MFLPNYQIDSVDNLYRPFFTSYDWKISELNTKLKLLHLNAEIEDETIMKLMELDSEADIMHFDDNSLR